MIAKSTLQIEHNHNNKLFPTFCYFLLSSLKAFEVQLTLYSALYTCVHWSGNVQSLDSGAHPEVPSEQFRQFATTAD